MYLDTLIQSSSRPSIKILWIIFELLCKMKLGFHILIVDEGFASCGVAFIPALWILLTPGLHETSLYTIFWF